MRMDYHVIIVSFFLLAIFSGCVSKPDVKATYVDINVKDAKTMIENDEVFILDVRSQGEYDEGHIKGSTRIPLQDIPQQEIDRKLEEIPMDKKILVYCRTGQRSKLASEILINKGFTKVYNIQGGITDWITAGYQVVK